MLLLGILRHFVVLVYGTPTRKCLCPTFIYIHIYAYIWNKFLCLITDIILIPWGSREIPLFQWTYHSSVFETVNIQALFLEFQGFQKKNNPSYFPWMFFILWKIMMTVLFRFNGPTKHLNTYLGIKTCLLGFKNLVSKSSSNQSISTFHYSRKTISSYWKFLKAVSPQASPLHILFSCFPQKGICSAGRILQQVTTVTLQAI